MPTDYAVQLHTALDSAFQAIRDALAGSRLPSFFHSPSWFQALVQHGSEPELALRLYVAHADGAPCCLLPLAVREGRLESLTNFYSIHFGPLYLGPPDHHRPGLAAIAQHIAAERPRWSGLSLRFLLADSPTQRDLASAFAAAGFLAFDYFQYHNWINVLDKGDADAFVATLPSTLRNTLQRKTRKLDREHQSTIRCYRDANAHAIDAFQQVYARSWKQPEPFPHFIPGLIQEAAAVGALRLGVLWLADTPIAAQLWLVYGETAMIYKLAYDEDYKALSAGSILSLYLFRQVIDEDGVRCIDYGVGSEPYKQDWMNHCREIHGMELHRWRHPWGLIAHLECQSRRMVKRLLQRLGR